MILWNVAEISRRRWRRGLKLNYIEATAIICDELLERAREGNCTVADLMAVGSMILTEEDVMDGTPALMGAVQLEVGLPDGNKLVSVNDPIRLEKRSEAIPVGELRSMAYMGT